VYPPILADRGLAGAIESLAGRGSAAVTVTVEVAARLPAALESTVYFVVSEALANVAKHSEADRADVTVCSSGGVVTIDVSDNGRGGEDEHKGSGLAGLRRRVAAFDGTMSVLSAAGGPTALHVEMTCAL
jgi:signal transduction histidine kinase